MKISYFQFPGEAQKGRIFDFYQRFSIYFDLTNNPNIKQLSFAKKIIKLSLEKSNGEMEMVRYLLVLFFLMIGLTFMVMNGISNAVSGGTIFNHML
ncbi:hypothetical protein [Desertibacillus haloalkaliphilus]|uniref:hypothetical protein n=1 Tax=Desertibacillus haloalkaliphilus TaxID=1328930 RepID=UPI001C25624C|nr:hypothetical protein [Desertibacillus haloalkaliphilus]MBU8906050.1 hypothetical protein [Desertibacillus haloalkaliphilus]